MLAFSNRRLVGLLLAALLSQAPAVRAQQASAPVQAYLIKALEAGRVKIGDPVYLKVENEWKSPDCKLRKGAILKGRVVNQTPRSKTQKTSQVALLFESGECGGRDMKPLSLSVAALIAPDPNLNLFADQESRPLSEAVGMAIGGGGGAGPALGGSSGGNLRSLTGAAATSFFAEPPTYKPPKAVLPGEVVGIADVKLTVGAGPEGSTVLTAAKHNLRLEIGSQFVLVASPKSNVPANANAAPPPAVADAKAPEETAAATTPVPDETDICAPPSCSIAPMGQESESGDAGATGSLSIRHLGFGPPPDREMFGFDYASAITYLGPTELLLTFNPHELIPRTATDAKVENLRIIRATLFDLKTMRPEQTLEWRVQDAEQYLWPIGPDRVLVHVGRELRMYGPGLKMKQKLALSGPLAFVRVSPSATYFVVGTVQERHSETTHRQLAEAEGREPEEDVEIDVFDQNFRSLVTVMRSSLQPPPVLTDDGEVRSLYTGRNHWRIVEITWTGQKRILAQVNSTCRPELTSLPSDLLFMLGCDSQAAGKWYRVLRPDGKPVLKGWSPSAELEQRASGTAASNVFAIGVAELAKPLNPDSPFHPSELKEQRVGIYRVKNGQKLFGLRVPAPLPAMQTFALSPDGGQLAILQQEQIGFYPLPVTPQHP